jgi:hypothetical protein
MYPTSPDTNAEVVRIIAEAATLPLMDAALLLRAMPASRQRS